MVLGREGKKEIIKLHHQARLLFFIRFVLFTRRQHFQACVNGIEVDFDSLGSTYKVLWTVTTLLAKIERLIVRICALRVMYGSSPNPRNFA